MAILGAHMSIAGGYYRAVEAAHRCGCDCVQLFTKNNNHTCHVFAAGYAMSTQREYRATMRLFDQSVGIDRIKAFHLNDSKTRFGSRVDRHAKIGGGQMGVEPFRFLLRDRRFRKIPMYLETPKGKEHGEDLDVINLRTLRGLLAG